MTFEISVITRLGDDKSPCFAPIAGNHNAEGGIQWRSRQKNSSFVIGEWLYVIWQRLETPYLLK
jgi:hypothetical protein